MFVPLGKDKNRSIHIPFEDRDYRNLQCRCKINIFHTEGLHRSKDIIMPFSLSFIRNKMITCTRPIRSTMFHHNILWESGVTLISGWGDPISWWLVLDIDRYELAVLESALLDDHPSHQASDNLHL